MKLRNKQFEGHIYSIRTTEPLARISPEVNGSSIRIGGVETHLWSSRWKKRTQHRRKGVITLWIHAESSIPKGETIARSDLAQL